MTVPSRPSGSASGPAPTSASEHPAPTSVIPGVHSASSHVAPSVQAPCGALVAPRETVTELAWERSTSLQPVASTLQSDARAATPTAYFARGRSLMFGGEVSLAGKARRLTNPPPGCPLRAAARLPLQPGPGKTPTSYQAIFVETIAGTSSSNPSTRSPRHDGRHVARTAAESAIEVAVRPPPRGRGEAVMESSAGALSSSDRP